MYVNIDKVYVLTLIRSTCILYKVYMHVNTDKMYRLTLIRCVNIDEVYLYVNIDKLYIHVNMNNVCLSVNITKVYVSVNISRVYVSVNIDKVSVNIDKVDNSDCLLIRCTCPTWRGKLYCLPWFLLSDVSTRGGSTCIIHINP